MNFLLENQNSIQKNPHHYYGGGSGGQFGVGTPLRSDPLRCKNVEISLKFPPPKKINKISCFLNFIWNPFYKIPGSTIVFSPYELQNTELQIIFISELQPRHSLNPPLRFALVVYGVRPIIRQSDSPTVRQSDGPTVRQSDSPIVRQMLYFFES